MFVESTMSASTATEGIIYAAIFDWEKEKFRCEYVQGDGNLPHVREILEAVSKKAPLTGEELPPGQGVELDKYKLYWVSLTDGYTIVVLCTKGYMVKRVAMFQRTIVKLFQESGCNCHDSDDCSKFEKTLKGQVLLFTNDPPKDKVDNVKEKQEEVKMVHLEDIELAIKRTAQIEINLDSTEDLVDESEKFKAASKQVAKTAAWQKYKMYLLIGGAALLVIAILIIAICASGNC